jgi:hypothetical protein
MLFVLRSSSDDVGDKPCFSYEFWDASRFSGGGAFVYDANWASRKEILSRRAWFGPLLRISGSLHLLQTSPPTYCILRLQMEVEYMSLWHSRNWHKQETHGIFVSVCGIAHTTFELALKVLDCHP